MLSARRCTGARVRCPFGAVVLALALAGCSDRPVVDTDSSTATVSTTATSALSSSSSDPIPDLGPVCGDASCSLGETCESCPEDCSCPLPAGLDGCPNGWEWAGSTIDGTTPFGDFKGSHAYFGWKGSANAEWARLTLHILDDSVSLEDAKADPWNSELYQIRITTTWSYAENTWLHDGPVMAEIVRDSNSIDLEADLVTYDVEGGWDAYDPGNPPMLHGLLYFPSLIDGPEGLIIAPFCDAFVNEL